MMSAQTSNKGLWNNDNTLALIRKQDQCQLPPIRSTAPLTLLVATVQLAVGQMAALRGCHMVKLDSC